MPFVPRGSLLSLGVLLFLATAIVAGFVWSGLYNIGADDTHTRPVYALLQALRDRSIDRNARGIVVPDLHDPALVRQGAGNYAAMCVGCHRGPGIDATELSRGLYPAPPALAQQPADDPAHQFWVVKHGIKASGMPAWGRSMDDRYIWGMVAFIQQLPHLDATQYRALVASSGGHSHGGGESPAHVHADGSADHHHDEATDQAPAPLDESLHHTHLPEAPPPAPATDPAAPATMTHRHADGTIESHPIEAADAHDETAEHPHDH